MEQINFRVARDEKAIIEILAKESGVSVAEFTKSLVLENIKSKRVEMAFNLLAKGKLGRKQTWIMSGLNRFEFLKEWTNRHAEEVVSDSIIDEEFDEAMNIDLKEFLKK